MSQSHSTAIWSEPAGSGAVPAAVSIYLVSDGAGGVTTSLTGPARYQLVDVEQSGDYLALDLTPTYLVSDGAGGITVDQVGPAAAILIDDGAGGITSGTDLTATPIADLLYDTAGDLWAVRRACHRFKTIQVRGDLVPY